ncbi:F-box domain containing protein [Parasponia andersonii]|uniref:F-box domain containing protein n=1 Tax=Parasponia andersonii TaxID=3476 RepID=A0A2P5ARA8_PARAD|nr:F-box domain containing protein [Parasponia andersonii]
MESSCCDLPEEALVEILSWVPPQSLIRFKCVSKSWYALINFLIRSPDFVNKHLRNIDKTIFSSTSLVLCCPGYGHWRHQELEFIRRKLFKSLTIFHDDNESDRINYACEDFALPILPSKVHISRVLGSHCDGIICQADHDATLTLCNPAINECRTLPKPCLASGDFTVIGVGFGVDPRANDYKVVRFGFESFPIELDDCSKTRAEVYSMGTDSWREIGINLGFGCFPDLDKEIFCKGIFYWSIWAPMYVIISFDMSNEVFNRIRLPNNLTVTQKGGINPKVTVWNDSVALFICSVEIRVPVSIQVWGMEECSGGVEGSCSWIKKLIIGPLVDIETPLTFLKNDELLLETDDGGLILYDFRTQKLKNPIFIEEVNRIRRWDFPYVKSLVSVHGGSHSRSQSDIGTG